MPIDDYDPLISAVPSEIQLTNAPLVRVISQVRFPIIVSIEKRDFIGPFQEAIRDTYPRLIAEKTRGLLLSSQVNESIQSQIIWRFNDAEGKWRASLAPEFVALETIAYTNRSEFLERFRVILEALNEYIKPKLADRLGIRYIDRINGYPLEIIKNLVRREVLGVLATTAANNAKHSLSESLFEIPDSNTQMLARWGQLPAGVTVDPGAIEPIDTTCWILDIDMFCAKSRTFNPNELLNDTHAYAERIYAFFRWAVKDEFLRQYGGEI